MDGIYFVQAINFILYPYFVTLWFIIDRIMASYGALIEMNRYMDNIITLITH